MAALGTDGLNLSVLCGTAGVFTCFGFFCMNTTINYITMPSIFLGAPVQNKSQAPSKRFIVPASDNPASAVPQLSRQWQEVYYRGHKVGPAGALGGGFTFGTASYLAETIVATRVFAAAAVASFAIVPYTLVFMLSTNDELHRRATASGKDVDEEKTLRLLSKWVGMSKTRANIALVAACLGVVGIIIL